MAETAEFETVEWVYLGRRVFSGGKLYHVFAPVDSTDDTRAFSKAPKYAVVGYIYAVESNGKSARITDAERLKSSDDDRLNEWRFRDREALTDIEALRATKRLHERNGDFGDLTLDHLKAIMRKQPQHTRAGTVATVLAYLGAT